MTKCFFCNNEMIWNNDFTFEDYNVEGDGIVSVLTCSVCEATAEFYSKIDDEK